MINPLVLQSIAHWLLRHHVRYVPCILIKINYGITGCDIPAEVKVGQGVRFPHYGSGCVIHPNTTIGDRVWFNPQVVLGQDTLSGNEDNPKVTLITVENDVMFGAGAKIIARSPISIGRGARIGANAVVLSSVPPDSTAVGIPAKVTNRRNWTQTPDPEPGSNHVV